MIYFMQRCTHVHVHIWYSSEYYNNKKMYPALFIGWKMTAKHFFFTFHQVGIIYFY